MPLVTSGVEHGNLRELALARMRDLGTACRDVRTREVGIVDIHTKVKPEQVRVPVPTSRHGPACAGVSLLRTDVRTHALAHATHARTHVRTRLDLRLSWCGETMLPMAAGKRFCRMKTRTVTYWCARAPSCVYMSTPWSQAGTATGRRCAARSASCACASVATRRTGPSSWAAPRLCASCTCTSTPPLPPLRSPWWHARAHNHELGRRSGPQVRQRGAHPQPRSDQVPAPGACTVLSCHSAAPRSLCCSVRARRAWGGWAGVWCAADGGGRTDRARRARVVQAGRHLGYGARAFLSLHVGEC
jgi:hypothetical protein